MNIESILQDKIESASGVFTKDSLFEHIEIPEFDCSFLTSPKTTDGKDLPEEIKQRFFSHLHQHDNAIESINDFPCIYAFELINEQDKQRVIDAFQKQREVEFGRTLPAVKNHVPNSKFLYVGKVQKELGGRLVTHLGYYQSKGNHGLQLAFWAREFSPPLKLRVHVFRFQKEFEPYVAAFEVMMAKELDPIIGKH